jgi:hypothetical protein
MAKLLGHEIATSEELKAELNTFKATVTDGLHTRISELESAKNTRYWILVAAVIGLFVFVLVR